LELGWTPVRNASKTLECGFLSVLWKTGAIILITVIYVSGLKEFLRKGIRSKVSPASLTGVLR
jgi:hypothetical protein